MRNYNIPWAEVERMPPSVEKALHLAVSGLLTDGAHHKQWFLEEILRALGENPSDVHEALRKIDYEWEPGIPP